MRLEYSGVGVVSYLNQDSRSLGITFRSGERRLLDMDAVVACQFRVGDEVVLHEDTWYGSVTSQRLELVVDWFRRLHGGFREVRQRVR